MGCGSPSSFKTNPDANATSPSPTNKPKTQIVVPVTGPLTDPLLIKKQGCITAIVDWYNKVNDYMTTHISLTHSVTEKLDKMIKLTTKGVEDLIDFFNERAHREEDYAKNKESLLSCFKEGTEDMYPNLNNLLKEVDNYHAAKSKTIKGLAKYIEHDIVKEKFKKSLHEFEKKMNSYKDKIHDIKKDAKNLLHEAQLRFVKYSKLFEAFVQAYQNPLKSPVSPGDDFYFLELRFVHSLQSAQDKAQDLGKLTNEYWDSSKGCQNDLMEGLKGGLTDYINKTHEIYGDTGSGDKDSGPINLQNAMGLLEKLVPGAEVLQKFDIGKICDDLKIGEQVLGVFKKAITKEDDMKDFFQDFEIPLDQSQRPLVRVEFAMTRDVGLLLKEFKDCMFYITVDNNLIVVDGKKEDSFGKEPKYCMNIENVVVVARKDPNLYDVVERNGTKLLVQETDASKINLLTEAMKKSFGGPDPDYRTGQLLRTISNIIKNTFTF